MKARIATDLLAAEVEQLRTIAVEDMRAAVRKVLNANDIHAPVG